MEQFLSVIATIVGALVVNSFANRRSDKRLEEEREHTRQIREEDARKEEQLRYEIREEERGRREALQERDDQLRNRDFKRLNNAQQLAVVVDFVDMAMGLKAELASIKAQEHAVAARNPNPAAQAMLRTNISSAVIQLMERLTTRAYLLSIQLTDKAVYLEAKKLHEAIVKAHSAEFEIKAEESEIDYISRLQDLPLPGDFSTRLTKFSTVAKFRFQEINW